MTSEEIAGLVGISKRQVTTAICQLETVNFISCERGKKGYDIALDRKGDNLSPLKKFRPRRNFTPEKTSTPEEISPLKKLLPSSNTEADKPSETGQADNATGTADSWQNPAQLQKSKNKKEISLSYILYNKDPNTKVEAKNQCIVNTSGNRVHNTNVVVQKECSTEHVTKRVSAPSVGGCYHLATQGDSSLYNNINRESLPNPKNPKKQPRAIAEKYDPPPQQKQLGVYQKLVKEIGIDQSTFDFLRTYRLVRCCLDQTKEVIEQAVDRFRRGKVKNLPYFRAILKGVAQELAADAEERRMTELPWLDQTPEPEPEYLTDAEVDAMFEAWPFGKKLIEKYGDWGSRHAVAQMNEACKLLDEELDEIGYKGDMVPKAQRIGSTLACKRMLAELKEKAGQ